MNLREDESLRAWMRCVNTQLALRHRGIPVACGYYLWIGAHSPVCW